MRQWADAARGACERVARDGSVVCDPHQPSQASGAAATPPAAPAAGPPPLAPPPPPSSRRRAPRAAPRTTSANARGNPRNRGGARCARVHQHSRLARRDGGRLRHRCVCVLARAPLSRTLASAAAMPLALGEPDALAVAQNDAETVGDGLGDELYMPPQPPTPLQTTPMTTASSARSTTAPRRRTRLAQRSRFGIGTGNIIAA